MEQQRVPISKSSLPVDVVVEMLTWLPVLTLLQLKLVCKDLKAGIESVDFKRKQYARSIACVWGIIVRNPVWTFGDGCPLCSTCYKCLGIYYGMLVETHNFRKKFRIRNPLLRRVIGLPDPHEGLFGIFLSPLPSHDDFKLISLFDNGKEAGNGCEILTLDGSANPSWRKLVSFPNLSQLGGKLVKTKFLSIGMTVHCILLFKNASKFCMHILSIEILNEVFLGIITPNFQFPDITNIEPFLYNGKLGLVQIVANGLQIYSLENRKDFVKNILLPLNFMRYDLMIFSVEGSEIWLSKGRKILVYDIVLKRVTKKKTRLRLETSAFPYKPSLFTIKGMELKELINPKHCYTELERI